MPGIIINPADQNIRAHYLNRNFAIQFNLPKLGKLADPSKAFPALAQPSALALCAMSLNRLQAALKGRSAATAPADITAWNAEIVAARSDATKAEAALAAAFPTYVTSAEVMAKLRAEVADPVPAPSTLPVDWATA